MGATAIMTADGWKPLWKLPPVTRETLQLNHQGWWMKDAESRRAFEAEQVSRINSTAAVRVGEAA